MVGRSEAGTIVQTPPPSQPAPLTLNAIVSMPAAALASRIAWRSDPGPESFVLVTVNVAPSAALEARSSSATPYDQDVHVSRAEFRILIESPSSQNEPRVTIRECLGSWE